MSTARRHPRLSRQRQSGVAAMLILFVIAVVAISLLVSAFTSSSSQTERDKITAAALAQAKAALIGYAANANLSSSCAGNCPRPGELPCPDNSAQGSINEGTASLLCDGNAMGRLPWKTLGLPDLRDAAGERLWYALSDRYTKNPRAFPLNSDTPGTIGVRDSKGVLFADGTSSTGMAAVVISPGAAFTRQDGVVQDRSPAGYNNPINYLDIDVASGEDNQNYINGSLNGFIQGPIKTASNSIILNDTLITLSRDDIMRVVEKRVAAEVINALGFGSFPKPAAFNDTTCLSNTAISATACKSDPLANRGRIAANSSPVWSGNAVFLNGISTNWFQRNAWREVIYYTIGSLTLNNPPATAITGRQALVIMTGRALTAQSRSSNSDKSTETNYLEEENSSLDDLYTLRPTNSATPFNDKVRCLPANPPQC